MSAVLTFFSHRHITIYYSWVTRGLGGCILALYLSGCQPANDNTKSTNKQGIYNQDGQSDTPTFIIDGQNIILSKKDILHIKTKRYQPSFGIQGITRPIDAITINTPTSSVVNNILVTPAQMVKKNTPLVVLTSTSTHNIPINTANTLTTQVDEIDNGQIDDDSTKQSDANLPDNSTPQHSLEKAQGKENIDEININLDKDNNEHHKKQIIKNAVSIAQVADEMAEDNNSQNNIPASQELVYTTGQTITLKAPFTGYIEQIVVKKNQALNSQQAVMKMSNPKELQFAGQLPIAVKPKLAIGKPVYFSAFNITGQFTGQISRFEPSTTNPKQLMVYVQVVSNKVNNTVNTALHANTNNEDKNNSNTTNSINMVNTMQNKASQYELRPGIMVKGRIDYGQIQVGTIIPKRGIHGADLSQLDVPPYQPATPIKANVWIINRDHQLVRQDVQVIEYDPHTEQYLVTGIQNDGLICLANLPADSVGKKVIVD